MAQFEIRAGEGEPYRVLEFPLPPLEGQHPFSLSIESSSENPRPLGLALDWIEIEGDRGGSFRLPPGASIRGALVGGAAAAVTLFLGGGLLLAAGHAGLLVLALFGGALADPLAIERILRNGAVPYATGAALTLLLLGLPASRRGLAGGEDLGLAPAWRGVLGVLVLAALAFRLALLLHPRFYYPDVRIHALFVRELARNGMGAFMAHFTDNQFRYSLGLQFESGHWYAFPYPPVFYLLCGPLVSVFRFSPEVAVALVPAVVNSLEALLVFAIARRLRLGMATALAAAAAVPLLPLFLVRLSLAYFPAITGHAVDALVVLAVLSWVPRMARPAAILGLAGLVCLALLTYTQSLVNLGLLLPLFLILQLAFDRAPGALRRHASFALAGALGALLAFGVFYVRYVPAVLAMRSGVAMDGESIVLERLARLETARPQAVVVEEQDDPYAQPTTDLWRGVRKSVHRVRIFYGPLALAVALGFLVLIKRSEPMAARFVVAWGATFVLICVGSGGLPGPNLLRYAKELELIAPLCAIAIAVVGSWIGARSRVLGAAYFTGGAAYGIYRLLIVWSERVMTLAR